MNVFVSFTKAYLGQCHAFPKHSMVYKYNLTSVCTENLIYPHWIDYKILLLVQRKINLKFSTSMHKSFKNLFKWVSRYLNVKYFHLHLVSTYTQDSFLSRKRFGSDKILYLSKLQDLLRCILLSVL